MNHWYWTESDSNGIKLLIKSWRYLLSRSLLLLHAFMSIGNTLLYFSIFFLFEYHVYGVQMFNIKTLDNFSPSGIIGHMGHFVALLFIILFSIFSSLFIRASLNYAVINDLMKDKEGISIAILYTTHHLYKLFVLSLIFLNHYIITFFDTLSISPFLTKAQNKAEGQPYAEPTLSKSMAGDLVIPVFLLNKTNSLSEALRESQDLIEKHFKNHPKSIISFLRIKLFLLTLATLAILISTPFDAIDTLATTFIAGFIVLTLFRIIEIGLTIYHGCLYSYCKGSSSGPFSKEELATFL